jgi:hypothetical protein
VTAVPDSVDGLTQCLRTDAERTRTVLVDLDTDHLGRLVPVEVDVLGARGIAKKGREALREIAHLRGVRAADTELQRPADRGAKFERAYPRHHVLELRTLQRSEDSLLYTRASFEALGDNDGLREKVVSQLLVERQVEANGAPSDIKRPALDVGVGLQQIFEVVDHLACRADRRALRESQIDEQLRAVRVGEELLLHELHTDESSHEQCNRGANHGVF